MSEIQAPAVFSAGSSTFSQSPASAVAAKTSVAPTTSPSASKIGTRYVWMNSQAAVSAGSSVSSQKVLSVWMAAGMFVCSHSHSASRAGLIVSHASVSAVRMPRKSLSHAFRSSAITAISAAVVAITASTVEMIGHNSGISTVAMAMPIAISTSSSLTFCPIHSITGASTSCAAAMKPRTLSTIPITFSATSGGTSWPSSSCSAASGSCPSSIEPTNVPIASATVATIGATVSSAPVRIGSTLSPTSARTPSTVVRTGKKATPIWSFVSWKVALSCAILAAALSVTSGIAAVFAASFSRTTFIIPAWVWVLVSSPASTPNIAEARSVASARLTWMPRLSRIIGLSRPTPLTRLSSMNPMSCPVAAETLPRYPIASGSCLAKSIETRPAAWLKDIIRSRCETMPALPFFSAASISSVPTPALWASPSNALLSPSTGAASIVILPSSAPMPAMAPTAAPPMPSATMPTSWTLLTMPSMTEPTLPRAAARSLSSLSRVALIGIWASPSCVLTIDRL